MGGIKKMDLDSVRIAIEELKQRFTVIKNTLKYDFLKSEVEKLQNVTMEDGFWNDSKKQSLILPKIKKFKDMIEKIDYLSGQIDEAEGYLQIADELNDIQSFKEAEKISKMLVEKLEKLEMDTLLSDEYDSLNAIVTIHPGAGGT